MLHISECKKDDFKKIHELMLEVHNLHVKGRPDIYKDSDPLTFSEYCMMIEKEESIFYAAKEEGEIIAFCFAYVRPKINNPKMENRKVVFIDDICVKEEYRRKGIGRQLLNKVRMYAKDKGAESIELMVWAFNKGAVDFYKNEGMKERSLVLEEKV